jgi:hypothetical protein
MSIMEYNIILSYVPSALDELIKRRVIQEWMNGMPRDKIAAGSNIGTGTVSGIIDNYKTQLEGSDFESVRALAAEIRKQGLTFADLASHVRLYNYFRQLGVKEDEIESFINRVSSSDIPKE